MSQTDDLGRPSVIETLNEAVTKTVVVPPGERPQPSGPPRHFVPAGRKYVVESTIGRGGMGEVVLVTDQDLRRQVAMKLMRTRAAASLEQRMKFVAEAQATGQLDHPGIPPIHDLGLSPEGDVYFTMKLVRGRTLGEVLRELRLGATSVRRQYSLHRLVSILERIAETLHFAHEKGVLHRDLKPANVMLGEFGEVHVMDWGLAKVSGESDEFGQPKVDLHESADSSMTLDGAIKGTVPYMSPEQAAGAISRMDRRSDVYALGCLLYEILTLYPAFDGREPGLIERVRAGEYRPVASRNPRRPAPPALADLCRRSMARDISNRPATAVVFGHELRAWLDGSSERARRHAEAERLAERGIALAATYREKKHDLIDAVLEAEQEAAKFESWQPVAEKSSMFDAARRVAELEDAIVATFADAANTFGAALAAEPGNATASRTLCDLWRERLDEAERAGDREATVLADHNLRKHDDGQLSTFLSGEGTLMLTSEPVGAEVMLYRFEEVTGVLRPTDGRSLGTTPIDPIALPMGSYLCTLTKTGFRDVRYPVHITRGRRWTGNVRMYTDEQIGAEFAYVPGGPFVYGNDGDWRSLPDFAIQRYPVTFREYSEYLAAVEEERGLERALKRIPNTPGDGPYMERDDRGVYRPLTNNIEGPARERCLREFGDDVDWRLPVAGLSWFHAVEFCEWKTRATGREWRLPTEEEREKAARGVDGRRFPWGDLADPSLGKCSHSRNEPTQVEPVGAFPTAESVYGVGDAAGNQWEWTDSWFDTAQLHRVLRGGSYAGEIEQLLCAQRYDFQPQNRTTTVGFRCARSL